LVSAWIHADDVVGMYLAALDAQDWKGPVNASAPEPVTNKELSRTLGSVLKRPALAPVPQCRPLRSDGGWYAVLQVPTLESEEALALRLVNAGVLVHPGYFFDFPRESFLVLSLLPEPAIFGDGLDRIIRVLGCTDSSGELGA